MTEPRAGAPAMASHCRAVPQWPFVSADGLVGGFVRTFTWHAGPAMGEENEGVFAGVLDGPAQQIDSRPPGAPPVLDSAGRRLLLSHGLSDKSHISIARVDRAGEPPVPLAEIPGSVQQLLWNEPANCVLALVSEPGADTASLTSGRPGRRDMAEPEVDEGPVGTRQIWSISLASGRARQLGPPGACVWELALAPDGSLVCVCSSRPGEDGWYSSFIGRLDPGAASIHRLYSPQWQVAWPAVAPDDGRVAFVEGWASDRGLVAGVVVVLGPDGKVQRRIEDLPADVTWLQWDLRGRLFFAGWHDLGTCWGYVDEGSGVVAHHERAALMGSPWRPSLALSGDGRVALACRSTETTPPEVVTLGDDGYERAWARGAGSGCGAPELSVVEGAWPGAGGEEIHGILLIPSPELAVAGNAAGLVVVVHGGPTIAYHHAFDPDRVYRLVTEGFSVLLPNPRGSVGRGRAFAQANHGDPAGAELEDVLAGARWAAQSGLVPPSKPALIGSSYGGYLSAVAATARAREIAAAVVGAGISDIASCRHTCNNASFYDLLLHGLPSDERVRRLCVERSPVYLAMAPMAPTLILHGEEDRCVPVSQAHELFNALRAARGEVELATYPREGHQLTEPEHLADYWARTVRWLSSHCGVKAVARTLGT